MPHRELPERLARLNEVANNLWWSWHPQARDLFRALDYPLWRMTGHNPVRQLAKIDSEKLQAAASDPAFLALYDSVMSAFDTYMMPAKTWFGSYHDGALSGPIAFFSMEFAIHNSLPIYAGGLGILAGDICKEASDLGLPLVGVGFMYPQGYFHQQISAEGWQQESFVQLDFNEAPINRVTLPHGGKALTHIRLGDRTVHIGAWKIRLGRSTIYLMDTNLEENSPQDQQLSARLYVADRELRVQQEIVLGIGGVRLLRALGIEPSVWHANEGHTAFMTLERIRHEVEKGKPFREAVRKVRATTVFTTHTPVPAGHDAFNIQLVANYFDGYWDSLAMDRKSFLALGQQGGPGDQVFNMTVLALKTADRCNAVSELHGIVSRNMWRGLSAEAGDDEVPITHVTNGIHVPTWIAPEMGRLYQTYIGRDWVWKHDDPTLWELITQVPDNELWAVHHFLKRKLMTAVLERAQKRWSDGQATPKQVLGIGCLLDPEALTIGFVRRFTEYKRPALVFRDIERLKRLVTDDWRPVQIVFAGKSHPADTASKDMLRQVYSLATDREFRGRIAFVEDYDMHMARYLTQGVDVWLNTPRRLNEACGTSGMKASLNGVLHLSVRDGWWHEAYNGVNGWAIGDGPKAMHHDEEDRSDAQSLYRLLEDEIVPLYYQRDRAGVPQGWIRLVKEAIRSVVPGFCARRMVKEYAERMYIPAARAIETGSSDLAV